MSVRKIVFGVTLLASVVLVNLSAFGQAALIAGSAATSKTAYTVPQGYNRILLISIADDKAAVGTITSVTYGGQALTRISNTTVGGQLAGEMWYLNEAGISAARTGAACSYDFVITWPLAPTNETVGIITLENIDQTTPYTTPAGINGASSASSAALNTGFITAQANGISTDVCFSDANTAHTPGGVFVEALEAHVNTTTTLAVSTRQVAATTTTESMTSTITATSRMIVRIVAWNGVTALTAPQTYYSRQTGAWDLNTTWSLTADGSSGAVATGVWPRRVDNVIIRATHNVTVNATDDNKICGEKPDNVGANVGSFAGSNLTMFYQTGNINISGTLTVTGIEVMFGGYTHILSGGTLTTGSSMVNVGNMEVDAGSTLTTADDICLAGNSATVINTNSISNDDLIMSWPQATLCGTGSQQLVNGSGSTVTFANGAAQTQICSTFTVTCSGVGCTGFPLAGTGTFLTGYTGPGGVGDATSNKFWLRADDLSLANNASVTSWPDASGNGFNATAQTPPSTTNQPLYNLNNVNTLPAIQFRGTDWLVVGNIAALSFVPGTNSFSYFVAYNVASGANGTFYSKAASNAAQRDFQYTFDTNAFTSFIGGSQSVGTFNSSGAWAVSSHYNNTTNRTAFSNENTDINNTAIGTATSGATDIIVGARRNVTTSDAGFNLTGRIGEMAVYNLQVTAIQRIIISNYLAAKYGVTLSANDLYTQDITGNGDYDFDVAGIGQFTDGSKHTDARGSGVVRMWAPNGLTNGEYLFWGRDATAYASSITTVGTAVDGTIIKERLRRIWRVSETGDVGTVNISFNTTGLTTSNFLGSNLRLLIDRDGDGFQDNDVTPISGSFAGNIVTFSGVNLQNGDRFTLGNIDNTRPLPIELEAFFATPDHGMVRLDWKTQTEINNDFFTVERSADGTEWSKVVEVRGAGNSNEELAYSSLDERPYRGISYYRLKQTDFDKTSTYSRVVKVNIDDSGAINVYPNPSANTFTVEAGFEMLPEQLRLLDILGRAVPVSVQRDGSSMVIDPGTIPAGIYFVQISNGFGTKTMRVVRK